MSSEERTDVTEIRELFFATQPVVLRSALRLGFAAKSRFPSLWGYLNHLPLLATLSTMISRVDAAQVTAATAEKTRTAVSQDAENERSGPLVPVQEKIRLQDGVPGADVPGKVWQLVIVGSGPGGAAAYKRLHSRFETLVIEKGTGSNYSTSSFHTYRHLLSDFVKGGQQVCFGRPFTVFAQASVIGGGSEANAGFYHELPTNIREHWLNVSGITAEKWAEHETAIRELLLPSAPKDVENDTIISRGATNMGFHYDLIPRWRTYSETGEFHQHGMSDRVWNAASGTIMAQTSVEHIDSSGPVLRLNVKKQNGEREIVLAERVVLAGGTIASPQLLSASGLLDHPAQFSFHPMVRLVAKVPDGFADGMDPYQAKSVDGKFKFGGGVSTPSLLAASLGRIVTSDEASTLRSIYASFIAEGHGGLTHGQPWFKYTASDRAQLMKAAQSVDSLIKAAGCNTLSNVSAAASSPSSVHIFGSLPLDRERFIPRTALLQLDSRIAVLDASILPTAPGVNPQAPMMVLVRALADELWR